MSEKFALIGAEKADPTSAFTLTLMCELLEVSSSGFYDWCAAPLSDRARRRATIATHVRAAFTAGRGSYGVRRVRQVLARSSDPQIASVSLKMARSIMQELDLHACQPRAYKVATVRDANAADLLALAQSMLFTGELAKAEPKALRCRLLHITARITRGQRKVFLRLAEHWPWALALAKAFTRLRTIPLPA